MEKCWRERKMLEKSVVEKCWRKESCREGLGKGVL